MFKISCAFYNFNKTQDKDGLYKFYVKCDLFNEMAVESSTYFFVYPNFVSNIFWVFSAFALCIIYCLTKYWYIYCIFVKTIKILKLNTFHWNTLFCLVLLKIIDLWKACQEIFLLQFILYFFLKQIIKCCIEIRKLITSTKNKKKKENFRHDMKMTLLQTPLKSSLFGWSW